MVFRHESSLREQKQRVKALGWPCCLPGEGFRAVTVGEGTQMEPSNRHGDKRQRGDSGETESEIARPRTTESRGVRAPKLAEGHPTR